MVRAREDGGSGNGGTLGAWNKACLSSALSIVPAGPRWPWRRWRSAAPTRWRRRRRSPSRRRPRSAPRGRARQPGRRHLRRVPGRPHARARRAGCCHDRPTAGSCAAPRGSNPPVGTTVKHLEMRYDAQWRPQRLAARRAGARHGGLAQDHVRRRQGRERPHRGRPTRPRRPMPSRPITVVLPNVFFGSYAALAARLAGAAVGRRAQGLHRAPGRDSRRGHRA